MIVKMINQLALNNNLTGSGTLIVQDCTYETVCHFDYGILII